MVDSNPGVYVMPFGKHKGESLNSIADSEEGLKYLDWLIGERPDLKAVREFLEQPRIKRELEDIIGWDS